MAVGDDRDSWMVGKNRERIVTRRFARFCQCPSGPPFEYRVSASIRRSRPVYRLGWEMKTGLMVPRPKTDRRSRVSVLPCSFSACRAAVLMELTSLPCPHRSTGSEVVAAFMVEGLCG